jgi:hypothetical protein
VLLVAIDQETHRFGIAAAGPLDKAYLFVIDNAILHTAPSW